MAMHEKDSGIAAKAFSYRGMILSFNFATKMNCNDRSSNLKMVPNRRLRG